MLRAKTAAMRHAEQSSPNMTPMVDVTLVILIFFMAAAGLAVPELLLRTELAVKERASASEPAGLELPAAELVIALSAQGELVRVTGLGLSGGTLEAVLAAIEAVGADLPDDASLVIQAEDAVPYEAVVRVRDALAAQGLERVSLR